MHCSWKIVLFVIANAVTVAPAWGGLLPVSATSTSDGTNFRYTYSIVLTSDTKIQTGDYFTIFDFPHAIASTAIMPAGWSLSTSPTGGNPNGTVPGDDPRIPNLAFTYSGPTINGQANLGDFSVDSRDGTSHNQPFSFTSLTQRVVDNANDSNITVTSVPTDGGDTGGDIGGTQGGGDQVPGVPEPATLLMMAIGLPLAGMVRYFRNKRPVMA